jgi:hypothetical protein
MADDDTNDNVLRFPQFERIGLNEIAKVAQRVGASFRYYTLVNRTPLRVDDPIAWAHEMAKRYECKQRTGIDPWRVTETFIGDIHISTVFLGLDHSFTRNGWPILFEMMIFGGSLDQFQNRCATWDEAEAMHAEAVQQVRHGHLRVVK